MAVPPWEPECLAEEGSGGWQGTPPQPYLDALMVSSRSVWRGPAPAVGQAADHPLVAPTRHSQYIVTTSGPPTLGACALTQSVPLPRDQVEERPAQD